MAEASAIAPFEFTYIIWAVVFGFLFWNEVPGITTIVGILILISSSLYISYREQQLEKQSQICCQQKLHHPKLNHWLPKLLKFTTDKQKTINPDTVNPEKQCERQFCPMP